MFMLSWFGSETSPWKRMNLEMQFYAEMFALLIRMNGRNVEQIEPRDCWTLDRLCWYLILISWYFTGWRRVAVRFQKRFHHEHILHCTRRLPIQ
mmetsp:Transcript_12626/g.22762  ORF Transcript_12626/g.22762 Transcript_12626/m.22762 type:complete len:94 (+) Transcript_12626:243-524(+)